ncbi:MAG: DinB family protein [Asgard group archaeon]|nr:DinB family protein [Asgard group archaeon]
MNIELFVDICRVEYKAVIKMLQEAIKLCPDEIWDKTFDEPPFWQQVYHTTYYMDFYLGDDPDKFEKRFSMKEDLKKRSDETLTKEQLESYLVSIKKKVKYVLDKLDEKKLTEENRYFWTGPTVAHRLVYNIRHSQHHIGILNSILRRCANDASKWVI